MLNRCVPGGTTLSSCSILPRCGGQRWKRGRAGCSWCRSARWSSTGRTCRWTPTPGSPSRSPRGPAPAFPGVGLAPAIAIGASGEHAGFPGTLSIGTEALTLLLVELGRHAGLHWPGMLLVNGHGGNAPAISRATATLRAEGRPCHAWHAALPGSPAADPHAGRFETSLMLALAPEPRPAGRGGPRRHPPPGRHHAGAASSRGPRGQPQRRPWRPRRRVGRRRRPAARPARREPPRDAGRPAGTMTR